MKMALSLAALFCACLCRAQERLTYYNEKGTSVKEKQAVLLEQNIKLGDSLWEINLYSINGPRIFSMQCSDAEGHMLNGRYMTYDRKGLCDTVGVFVHGHKEGHWQVMTEKGRVRS